MQSTGQGHAAILSRSCGILISLVYSKMAIEELQVDADFTSILWSRRKVLVAHLACKSPSPWWHEPSTSIDPRHTRLTQEYRSLVERLERASTSTFEVIRVARLLNDSPDGNGDETSCAKQTFIHHTPDVFGAVDFLSSGRRAYLPIWIVSILRRKRVISTLRKLYFVVR